jgi:UDPglucose 6-dehydrogenase
LENPDRVIIGSRNTESGKSALYKIRELYECWISSQKIIETGVFSSELSKLAANAFLAQRISSINSLSLICEEVGADIQEISKVFIS